MVRRSKLSDTTNTRDSRSSRKTGRYAQRSGLSAVYGKAPLVAGVLLGMSVLAYGLHAAEDPAKTAPATTDPASAAAPAEPVKRVMLDPVTEQIAALAKEEHPPTQVLTLGDAPDQFLGLYVPRNTALVNGGVILVPQNGTHPDWPGAIHSLRLRLPDYGWDSLSIAVPPLPDPAIPERTLPVLQTMSDAQGGAGKTDANGQTPAPGAAAPAANAAAPAQDNKLPEQNDTPAPAADDSAARATSFFNQVNARIRKAEDYLKAQGVQKIVVLGVGSGATLAAQYLAGQKDNQATLVMVDAKDVNQPKPIDLLATLAGFNGPVLDLYHGNYRQMGATLRRNSARRYGKLAYEQIRLISRPDSTAEDWEFLVQRVRSWLKTRQQEKPVDPRPANG